MECNVDAFESISPWRCPDDQLILVLTSLFVWQVPGLTVPAGDLPVLILALILSQIIHEVGHAITGAMYVNCPLLIQQGETLRQ